MAYAVGLQTLQHLRMLFPAWYDAHLAHRRLTSGTMLGAAEAFLALVDQQLFPLYRRWFGHSFPDPERALDHYAGNSADWLSELAELEYDLKQPCPGLWGLGVSVLISGDDELATDVATLTCALWHMFHHTTWSPGVDMAEWMAQTALVEPIKLVILQLPQLPATTPLAELRQCLNHHSLDGAGLGDLVAYAHAASGNAYADISNIELDEEYGGQTDFTWQDAPQMREPLAQARILYEAYQAWAHRVHRAPERELSNVVQHLTAALLAVHDATLLAPQPLIESLDLSVGDVGIDVDRLVERDEDVEDGL